MKKQIFTLMLTTAIFATTPVLLKCSAALACDIECIDPYNDQYWGHILTFKRAHDIANERETAISNVEKRKEAINTILCLYEKNNALQEEDKAKIRKHLDVRIGAAEIQQTYEQFGVIPVRPLTNSKLILGCGNAPIAYADDREIQQAHSHHDYDTIDPDILMHPGTIAAFPPLERMKAFTSFNSNLLGYLNAKARKYEEIFIEGICLFDLKPDQVEQNLNYLYDLLEDGGILTSNVHGISVYDNQFITANAVLLDCTHDRSNPRNLFVQTSNYKYFLTAAHLLDRRVGTTQEGTHTNQRLINHRSYCSMRECLDQWKNRDRGQTILDNYITNELKPLVKTRANSQDKSLEDTLLSYGFTFESFSNVRPVVPKHHWLLQLDGHLTFKKQ